MVSVGDSQDAVRKVFGEPQDVSVKKNPEIWKYEREGMELAFYRDKSAEDSFLESIHFYFFQKSITPEEFRHAASVFGIELREAPELTFGGVQLAFIAKSGVSIIFIADSDGFQLNSMHFCRPAAQIGKTDRAESYHSAELKDSEILHTV